MSRSRHLVVAFCLSVFGGMTARVAAAQSAAQATPSTSFRGSSGSQATAKTDEVIISGTIEEVRSAHTQESPRGLSLVLAGPQGTVNASVGPYLATDIQQSLAVGRQVKVTGVNRTYNGENYLLVRQLTIGDQKVTVRNEKGFLLHPAPSGARRNAMLTKGGAQ